MGRLFTRQRKLSGSDETAAARRARLAPSAKNTRADLGNFKAEPKIEIDKIDGDFCEVPKQAFDAETKTPPKPASPKILWNKKDKPVADVSINHDGGKQGVIHPIDGFGDQEFQIAYGNNIGEKPVLMMKWKPDSIHGETDWFPMPHMFNETLVSKMNERRRENDLDHLMSEFGYDITNLKNK